MILKRGTTMKARKIVLLAALPAAILMANSAMAGVDVYGKINVTLQDYQLEDDATPANDRDHWELNSNASRFGVKASQDLGDSGLKAIAKLEYQIDADNGTNSNNREFSQRNIYGGLQGNFGTVIAGKFDTPVKEAQGKVDLFNDLKLGDISDLMEGENRPDNIIMYSTPKMDNGLSFNAAIMPGEGADLDIDGATDDGVADAVSASVTWENKNLYLALAAEQGVDAMDSLVRLVGQVKMGDMTLGAIIQQSEKNDNDTTLADEADEQEAYTLSLAYKMGKAVFKAQYTMSETDDVSANNDIDRKQFNLGVDYSLDKKAKVFAYWGDYTLENSANSNEVQADTIAFGYEYSF